MITNRRHLAAGALLGIAGLGACARGAPVTRQTGAEFLGRASLGQRAEQIRAAAAGLGWATDARGPGLTRAILNIRSHQAVVDISYDAQRFLISYVSSVNLDYDGNTIHRSYNAWVQNLQNAIVAQSGNQPVR